MEILRRALPQRLILFALGVGAIFAGVKLAALHLGLSEPLRAAIMGTSLELGRTEQVFAALLGAGGLAVLGVLFLVLSLAGLRVPERQFVLKVHGEGIERARGEIRVAERGLTKMIAWTLEDVEGVNAAEPRIQLGRDGWEVRCTIALWQDAAIHEVGEEVRRQLRYALERHTGLQVGRIDLLIQHSPVRQRVA